MGTGQRVVMLADCQSFYASVEKAAHPEFRDRPVVVAGDPAHRSGIVLAACPIAKSFGVTTAERLGEALAKCPELVVLKPRMEEYIRVSLQITDILQSYTDLVEPYSIDEQFLDVTGSARLFGDPASIARHIQARIREETGVRTRIGIAENKALAKMACDNYAKKNECGVYMLRKDKLDESLWQLPVHNMFMIGARMTQHLHRMGIHTIGDLARTPLEKLKERFGREFGKNSDIHAEVLWRIANGHDDSPVSPNTFEERPKSIGHQMTLPRDYMSMGEIRVALLELSELVCQRCRAKGVMGRVVSVGCQGADFDRPSGFYRQMKMEVASSVTDDIFRTACVLFERHWDRLPVRKVAVTLGELTPDREYQLTLIADREKQLALERAADRIKQKYGNAAIMRASSATPAGQAKSRSQKIGGHSK